MLLPLCRLLLTVSWPISALIAGVGVGIAWACVWVAETHEAALERVEEAEAWR